MKVARSRNGLNYVGEKCQFVGLLNVEPRLLDRKAVNVAAELMAWCFSKYYIKLAAILWTRCSLSATICGEAKSSELQ